MDPKTQPARARHAPAALHRQSDLHSRGANRMAVMVIVAFVSLIGSCSSLDPSSPGIRSRDVTIPPPPKYATTESCCDARAAFATATRG
jgi:hypothetical protein